MPMRKPLRRAVGGLIAAAALAPLGLSGCKDRGAEHYQKARAQYQALLEQAKRPTDKAFDPVIRELSQVSASSAAYPEAQRMLKALEAARQTPPPPKPLVTHAPSAPEPADVAAQREKCIEISQQLGEAKDPAARARLGNALKVCQLELERAQESHHSDNP